MESQVQQNTTKRVALAAAAIAAIIGIAAGHKQIATQVTRAIKKLPDFYEAVATSRNNAWVDVLSTESSETAERAFLLLTVKHRGSKRFSVNQGSIAFMVPQGRYLEEAVAARARIPGIYAVMSREMDSEARGLFYSLRLTSRVLDRLPPRHIANITPLNLL